MGPLRRIAWLPNGVVRAIGVSHLETSFASDVVHEANCSAMCVAERPGSCQKAQVETMFSGPERLIHVVSFFTRGDGIHS
jgi:hypothetical protein